MSQATQPTILLIEADPSLRRLISLGLQYRGMRIIEASSPNTLLPIETIQPALLVLDIDRGINSDWSLLAAAQTHPSLSTLPIIVLAWECLVPAGIIGQQPTPSHTELTCLAKPFDARALHTTIEQLLATSTSPVTQQLILTAPSSAPAPSIWPLITAAGLLLTFIGLMGQLIITALGVLVVIVALLWWTLGPKFQPTHSLSA